MQGKQVLPHKELQQIDARLWTLEGVLPHHNLLPRTMTIFKMKSGGLWIHSAIAVNNKTQKEIEALGRPEILVVPNPDHRLDASLFKETWPRLKVVCPKAAMESVRKKVDVDMSCEDAFLNSEIVPVQMPGAKKIELAYELELDEGKALVITDLIANTGTIDCWQGTFLKVIGRVGAFIVPPLVKFRFLSRKVAFKHWLIHESKKNIRIVTVAHGEAVKDNVQSLLLKAARSV